MNDNISTSRKDDITEEIEALFAETNSTDVAEKEPAKEPDKTTDNTQPKKKSKKSKIAKKGQFRTTTPFFVCGLIACIPVAGFGILLYLRSRAKDLELKSLCEALLLLRPLVFTLNLLMFMFIIMVAAKVQGVI